MTMRELQERFRQTCYGVTPTRLGEVFTRLLCGLWWGRS